MRVCVLPGDPDGPGHYRCLFPAMALREAGHEAAMPPHSMTEREDGFLLVEYREETLAKIDADVYVLHACLQPGSDALARDLRWRGGAVVVDVDDYVLGVPTYIPNWREIHARAKYLHAAMAAADCVTVTTPFLAEQYARYAERIEVLPNYLYWPMWAGVPLQYEQERERVRIGWMGSSGWRMADLRVLQGIIGPFLRDNPDVDFVAAGDEKVHEILEVPEGQRVTYPHVNFRSWSDPRARWKLPQITATMDIGLVPLAATSFNEGKSHLKGMEYAACGIPCIASPSSAYREWLAPGSGAGVGALASSPRAWTRLLGELVRDVERRREMGRAARAKAEEHTIAKHIGEWERLYAEVANEHDVARESIRLGAVQKHAELKPFLALVEERRPKTVVEIGTATGGNFHALACAADPNAFLISIDLPGADGYDYGGSVDFEKLKELARPFQRTHFIRSNSHLEECRVFLEQLLEGRTIDLLFIDGDHSYAGVKADFELYEPLVDGLIAFHDVATHPGGLRNQRGELTPCDVDRYWREIKRRYPHDEFIDPRTGPWGGIGVLHLDRAKEKAA